MLFSCFRAEEKKDMQRLKAEVKKGQKNKQKIEMHQVYMYFNSLFNL